MGTSLALQRFVREVRESRSELHAISTELHSLDGVLDLLKDDSASLPAHLAEQTPGLLDSCLVIINELEGCISVLNRPGVSRTDKKSRWLASREHIDRLRWTLEGYKTALGLAVDLVGETDKPQEQDSLTPDGRAVARTELLDIARRIANTTEGFRDGALQNGAVAKLQQYLIALHAYAVTAADLHLGPHDDKPSGHERSMSIPDAPDSAIELSYDQSFPPHPAEADKKGGPDLSIDVIHELLDELSEMPPMPPPRSLARQNSSPAPVQDIWDHRRGGHSIDSASNAGSDLSRSTTVSTSRSVNYSLPRHAHTRSTGHLSETAARHAALWENPRVHVPPTPHNRYPSDPNPRPSSPSRPQSSSNSSLVRRSSSRFASVFRGIGRSRGASTSSHQPPTTASQSADADAIFGVPLAASMQVAKGLAGPHGRDREYPLCILRCVYHIRADGGISTPHIFGQDADPAALARLKSIFSAPETGYGKELDWAEFAVHDAADMILAYLSELPQPIVSEALGKRWVSLSRQATISGSFALRLDQGIDFWEEALWSVHGHARNLVKLLLNLWGDVAEAAEENEMTAERLAGRLLAPLMGAGVANRGRSYTDLLLGLAFVIRKRSEHNVAARGGGKKSRAAF